MTGVPYNMNAMRLALPPVTPRARGGVRQRRGRGRGGQRPGSQPSAGVNQTRAGSVITVRDTEYLEIKGKFHAYQMNPSTTDFPRLEQMGKMYKRFRFKYCNVAYRSGSGTATAGSVTVGIMSGPQDGNVTGDRIIKLRPSFFVPAWKNDSLTLGSDIDIQKWLLCDDASADGVAFTIYVNATAESLGLLQVSYEVQFDQPRPF